MTYDLNTTINRMENNLDEIEDFLDEYDEIYGTAGLPDWNEAVDILHDIFTKVSVVKNNEGN